MAPLPIHEAQIVGLFMESVCYGVYLVTFVSCMRVLLFQEGVLRSFSSMNMKMIIAALLMFLFGTMDVAFGLRHNLDAFIYSQEGAIEEFSKTSHWVNVMKMVNYVAQTFVGDSILIYRCWTVYNRMFWIVLVPILLWLGETACGIATSYLEATMNHDRTLNSQLLIPFISSMLSLTLATNLLTTSLLVRRIWSVHIGSQPHCSIERPERPLANLLRVLIESGVLYTSSVVVLFVLYMTSNNGQLGVSDAVVQIIGITFNLVITCVADRREPTDTLPTVSTSWEFVRADNSIAPPISHSETYGQGKYVINTEKSIVRHHSPSEGHG